MFDVGWSELLLIGVVALIVIGPEDLPRMFHTLGRLTAKARAMGREFTSAMDDAARQSGVKEAADSLREVKSLTSKKNLGLDALDRAVDKFEKWDPKLPGKHDEIRPDPGVVTIRSNAPESAAPGSAAPEPATGAAAVKATDAAGAAAAGSDNRPAGSSGRGAGAGGGDHGEGQPRRRLKAVRRADLGE